MSSTAHDPTPHDPTQHDDTAPEGPELLLLTDHSTTALLEQLARTARRRVPGVAEASVTLLQDGRVSSVGWTGLLAYELDEAQFVAGHGPCVDAARSGVARWVQDSRVDRRWPVYLDAAVARGALSSFSVPIPITTDDGLRAGLNLYSTVADGFSVQARETAVEVVVAAAPAVANRHVYDLVVTQVEHLHRAMETRSVIDVAKGVLAFGLGLSADEAFTVLARRSQNTNVKVLELAAQLLAAVAAGEGPAAVAVYR
jgi:hypothetical protein